MTLLAGPKPGKLWTPLKWHGGKGRLAPWIVGHLDRCPHRRYIEPFAGGLSVFLQKKPVPSEILADVDPQLVAFWRAVRDCALDFATLAGMVPYEATSFHNSELLLGGPCRTVDQAVAFLVRHRMSIGGLGKAFSKSDRLRGGQIEGQNAWDNMVRNLPRVSARLQGTALFCDGFDRVIPRYAADDSLIYCDPPYLPEKRTAKKCYRFEMTREDHGRLLGLLLNAPGKRFISGYRSEMYDSALCGSGWKRHEKATKNNSGVGKKKQDRVECLWESP